MALCAAAVLAQPLPPAKALVLDDSEERAVLIPIEAILTAFSNGDAAAMLTHVYPDGRVTATGTRGATSIGLRTESWTQFALRITPATKFDERIYHPAIEIDGDVAMVWAAFVVRRDGKISNCGYDHFDLVRENGVWKVMNLSFSSRTSDCGE